MSDLSIRDRRDGQPRRAWRWLRTGVLDSRYMADPEWLIGVGRLVTAAFAAIAIYFDPTQPGRLADEARLLILAYIAFSLLALIPIRWPVDSRMHLLTHAVDIVVIGWLLHLTDELTSPFFAFFHFLLFAATIRWGMTGALLGAVVLEVLLLIIGLPDLEDGVSELNLMIMRSAYFLVAAFMLGYFGAYRNRSRYRLARLAAWPRLRPESGADDWLGDILTHATEVLGAAQLIVVWQDIDEPTGTIATCNATDVTIDAIRDPARWQPIAEEVLDSADPRRAAHARATVAKLNATADDAAIALPPDNVSAAYFSALRYRGRVLVLDAKYRHEEVESLVSIIAGRISYELERMALMREIASNARLQERGRVARDLHDSVLQDLTAASLKLKAAARLLPPQAGPLIGDVAAIIADQQRQIRRFVEGTRPGDSGAPLPGALARHVDDLERQWDCEIHLTAHPDSLKVSDAMSDDLAKIISEATSNAVRHGAATRLDLAVTLHDGVLQLGIADNGKGLADDKARATSMPLSLGARVADLAGRLSIVRQRPGFALLIELPAT